MKTFEAGQVFRVGRAYQGNGHYAPDDATGQVVRLLRPLAPADWYVSTDLGEGLNARYTMILHESRLRVSLRVRDTDGYLPGQRPYTATELKQVRGLFVAACEAEDRFDLDDLERLENSHFRV